MNSLSRKWLTPSRWIAALGSVGLLGALWFASIPSEQVIADESKTASELDRVPEGAVFLAHGRVSDVLNGPLAKEVKTGLGKALPEVVKQFEKSFGIPLDQVDRITVWMDRIDMDGPPDVGAIFKTLKPYDKEALKKHWHNPNHKQTNPDLFPINHQYSIHFTDATTFALLEKSVAEAYLKPGPAKETPLKEVFKLAKEKHGLVWGMHFASVPPDAFNDAPVQIQPFLPLLKCQTAILVGDADPELKADLRLICKNKDSAVDAERSWKLLMRLASDGIDFVMKDKNAEKEAGFLFPVFKEVQKMISEMKIKTNDNQLELAASLKTGQPIAKLVAQVVESLQKVSGASENAVNFNNMKQIAIAFHNYADVHSFFPPAAICDKKGKPLLSWRVAILPYIEQDNVYKQFKLDEPWDSEHNIKLAQTVIKVYATPGTTQPKDSKGFVTHYKVFRDNGAVLDLIQSVRFPGGFPDGTSNTLLVVDAAEGTIWSKPDDIEFDPKKDMRKHLRLVNDKFVVGLCDGSVRTLKKTISEMTLRRAIQRDDGEVLGDDFE